MFTEEQINTAHAAVKTGADFPAYIRQLKSIGVTYYETFVRDAHSVYYGKDRFELLTAPKFDIISISGSVNAEQFQKDLAYHQQGGSGFPEFVRQCAGNGIAKWAICLDAMTCTYYDPAGNQVLVEQIPASDR